MLSPRGSSNNQVRNQRVLVDEHLATSAHRIVGTDDGTRETRLCKDYPIKRISNAKQLVIPFDIPEVDVADDYQELL